MSDETESYLYRKRLREELAKSVDTIARLTAERDNALVSLADEVTTKAELQADNTRLTARVKELEERNAKLQIALHQVLGVSYFEEPTHDR